MRSRGSKFTSDILVCIQARYGLQSRYDRLRQRGSLPSRKWLNRLHVHPKTVKAWSRYGLLKSFRFTDKGEALYKPIDPPLLKQQGRKLRLRAGAEKLFPESSKRVQYANVRVCIDRPSSM